LALPLSSTSRSRTAAAGERGPGAMLGPREDAGTGCCGDVRRERLVPLARLARAGLALSSGAVWQPLGVREWALLVPPGKVTPSAVACRECVTCRNTMVLNRPWPGRLIDRIYHLLYFKSLSGSCPESRSVFAGSVPRGGCAGHASGAAQQTRPAGTERRAAAALLWGEGRPLREQGSGPGPSPWALASLARQGWHGPRAGSLSVQA